MTNGRQYKPIHLILFPSRSIYIFIYSWDPKGLISTPLEIGFHNPSSLLMSCNIQFVKSYS